MLDKNKINFMSMSNRFINFFFKCYIYRTFISAKEVNVFGLVRNILSLDMLTVI